MEVLWEKGPATVWGVLEGLAAVPRPAYSTVITTLRILEKKGYVRHKKDGGPLVGAALRRFAGTAHEQSLRGPQNQRRRIRAS
jgi:predicted transcriptional regulator